MSRYYPILGIHTADPVLHGITGDACGACSTTNVPLYDLSCHESDDFYCRNCLTKTWYGATDDVVRCPYCGKDCDFMPLRSIGEWPGISREFRDNEALDKMRAQPEVMNNMIGFTARDAVVFLEQVYNLVEDQILNPVELGGLPSYQVQTSRSAAESLASNPFYCGLIAQVAAVPKMMTTPFQLEEDLITLLDDLTVKSTKFKYSYHLEATSIDIENDEHVLQYAVSHFPDIKEVRDNWIGIIKLWVDMLAWRHLERVAPAEGGAAERLRRPSNLAMWN